MFENFIKELQALSANLSPLTVGRDRLTTGRCLRLGKETIPIKASLNQFVVGIGVSI
ncbi:MAG TPA: hypothetical protein VJ464_23385 [Blastocatellia bacterium]|nr:hypothetical protein [Blastocatellia bacterium]